MPHPRLARWCDRAWAPLAALLVAAQALLYAHAELGRVPGLAALITWETVHPKETAFFLIAAAALLIGGLGAAARGALDLRAQPLLVPWLLWLVWQTAGLAGTPGVGEGAKELQRQIGFATLALLAGAMVARAALWRLTAWLLVVGALSSGIAVLRYWSNYLDGQQLAVLRAEGLFGHPTLLAGFEILLLVVAVGVLGAAATGADASGSLPPAPRGRVAAFLRRGGVWAAAALAGAALPAALVPRPWLPVLAIGATAALVLLLGAVIARARTLERGAGALLVPAAAAALALGTAALLVSFSRGGLLGLGTAALAALALAWCRRRERLLERAKCGAPRVERGAPSAESGVSFRARGGAEAGETSRREGSRFLPPVEMTTPASHRAPHTAHRARMWLTLGALLVAALFVGWLGGRIPAGEFERLFRVRSSALDNTVRLRHLSFRDCVRGLTDGSDGRWWAGSGLGSFHAVFPRYQGETFGQLAVLRGNYLHHAHNEFLEVWCETGLVGLLLYGALLLCTFRTAFQAVLGARDPRRRRLLAALAAALAGLAADSMVSINFRFVSTPALFWFCAGLLAGEWRAQRATAAGPPPAPDPATPDAACEPAARHGRPRRPWHPVRPLPLGPVGGSVLVLVAIGAAALLAVLALRQFAAQRAFVFGLDHLEQRRHTEAFRALERAAALDPWRPYYRYRLALAQAAAGAHEEALRAFAQFARSNPAFPRLHYDWAASAAARGRDEEALVHLDRELEYQPHFAPAHLLRAELALRRERPRQARAALARYRAYRPFDAYGWRLTGEAHRRESAVADAEAAFRRAAALAPDDPVALVNLAALADQGGRFDEAVRSAVQVARLGRPFFPVVPPVVRARPVGDDESAADSAAARALEARLRAGLPDAAAREALRTANLYVVRNLPDLADLLDRARGAQPPLPLVAPGGGATAQGEAVPRELALAQALLAVRAAQYDAAARALRRRLDDDPGDAEAAFYLGQVEERREQPLAARAAYEHALQAGGDQWDVLAALRDVLIAQDEAPAALRDLDRRLMALETGVR